MQRNSTWVNKVRKEKGLPLLAEGPQLFPDVVWVWNGFMHLSKRRPQGFSGALPITIEAIDAYARLKAVRTDDLDFFFTAVTELDDLWLVDYDDRAEREKAKRKSREGRGRARR